MLGRQRRISALDTPVLESADNGRKSSSEVPSQKTVLMKQNYSQLWNHENPSLWAIIILLLLSIPVHFFDKKLFQLLNGIHWPLTDIFWLSFTTLGDGLLICMILGCFLLINPRITALGLTVFLISSITVNLIKYAVPSARPLELLQVVHITGPVLRWGSFPSGHTAAGFSACLAIAGYAQGNLFKGLVLLVASLIGFSRIFVGAHFPSDVLWGCICAVVVFHVVTFTIWPKIKALTPPVPDFGNVLFKCLFFAQCGISLFGLLVYSIRFSEYPPAAIAISVGVIVFMCLKMHEIVPIIKNR